MDQTYRSMNSSAPSAFARAAIDFGIDPIKALRMRFRYLREQLEYWLEHDDYRWCIKINETLAEIRRVTSHGRMLKAPKREGDITDSMITQAAKYPITSLVEFVHGRTLAFCHDDRSPSAYYGTKTNRLFCPVCAKSFNSIDILVQRDGMSFPDAVRRLQ